jgi:hypothetical protein
MTFIALAVLTFLLPIYAWLLASVFLILFIALAGIIVPIGRWLLDKHESATEVHDQGEEQRNAA